MAPNRVGSEEEFSGSFPEARIEAQAKAGEAKGRQGLLGGGLDLSHGASPRLSPGLSH